MIKIEITKEEKEMLLSGVPLRGGLINYNIDTEKIKRFSNALAAAKADMTNDIGKLYQVVSELETIYKSDDDFSKELIAKVLIKYL